MNSHSDGPFPSECAPEANAPLLVKVKDAAYMLAVEPGTIRKWIATNKIYSVKLNSARRIPMTEVKRMTMEGMPLDWAH